MSLVKGDLPADDVIVCLLAVLVMAGILCTFFLPKTRRRQHHIRRHHSLVQIQVPTQPVAPEVNRETYIEDPPERSQEAVYRPVLQSPEKCQKDYELCMASLGPINQQTVLSSKPVRVISYPLDVISGVEHSLDGHIPPLAPIQFKPVPTNLMTR